MHRTDDSETCALVLGGYINGYSIIRELSDFGVQDVWLFDYGQSLSRYSNRIKGVKTVEKDPESLKRSVDALHKEYKYIVIYPTDDLQLEFLNEIYDDISSFCFLPFNRNTLSEALRKDIQYAACKKLEIPYPASLVVTSIDDYDFLDELKYPLLVKPLKRDDLREDVFRNLFLETPDDMMKYKFQLDKSLESGVSLLVSEYVPGDGSNIYAYVAYRSQSGVVLNDWVGKKLSQYPDDFGVFSSASNNAPEVVRDQGVKLINELDLYGICEPEFKYDARYGTYKLMEINLRSMMWHRLGNLCGVNLQYSQWLDAHGSDVLRQRQIKDNSVHFVYMKHELLNLFFRKGYVKNFIDNLFKADKVSTAVYDLMDLRPFLYDALMTLRLFLSRCLSR